MSGHTYIHTHTCTHDNYNNPHCAHAHRGLIKYSKRCSSIAIIQRTVYTYAKPLNMKHMRYSGIIIKRNALRVSKHVTESIRTEN